MRENIINSKYQVLDSAEELSIPDKELYDAAVNAADKAYAPYSKFHVGSAVRLENGEIISAANQENAAYPSGLCAERSTLFYAHSKYPNTPVVAIAIVAKTDGKLTPTPTYPCGACRQVLHESQIRGGKPRSEERRVGKECRL